MHPHFIAMLYSRPHIYLLAVTVAWKYVKAWPRITDTTVHVSVRAVSGQRLKAVGSAHVNTCHVIMVPLQLLLFLLLFHGQCSAFPAKLFSPSSTPGPVVDIADGKVRSMCYLYLLYTCCPRSHRSAWLS